MTIMYYVKVNLEKRQIIYMNIYSIDTIECND